MCSTVIAKKQGEEIRFLFYSTRYGCLCILCLGKCVSNIFILKKIDVNPGRTLWKKKWKPLTLVFLSQGGSQDRNTCTSKHTIKALLPVLPFFQIKFLIAFFSDFMMDSFSLCFYISYGSPSQNLRGLGFYPHMHP